MARILAAIGVDSSALIATSEPNVVKSARNLPEVKTMPANLLNVVDLLTYKRLLMPVSGVQTVEELWGENLS